MSTPVSDPSTSPAREGLTPGPYARTLVASLGRDVQPVTDGSSAARLWAESGAMALSGHAGGVPRPCPAPLAACARGAWLALAALSPRALDTGFAAHRLLGERAAIAGLTRQGRTSPGGACRLLDAADGVLALNLARDTDRELLPAWLEQPVDDDGTLTAVLRDRPLQTLIERARLLGLAASPLVKPQGGTSWFRARRYSPPREPQHTAPLVIDLSTLWAGPLCGQLLGQTGARVIKVEGHSRPDGARNGPADFFHLMNAGKESVALDLRSESGRAQLRRLLACADIVIESARPRGLEQMGIRAAELIAENPGMVWLGITGYGHREPMREWIAYGDDAGVAAGLSWLMGGDRGDPVFCGDAIADPLTGLHGALLALSVWQQGGGQLLDLSLCDLVAYCIAAGRAALDDVPPEAAAPPVARPATALAAELGEDTGRVLREFSL